MVNWKITLTYCRALHSHVSLKDQAFRTNGSIVNPDRELKSMWVHRYSTEINMYCPYGIPYRIGAVDSNFFRTGILSSFMLLHQIL